MTGRKVIITLTWKERDDKYDVSKQKSGFHDGTQSFHTFS